MTEVKEIAVEQQPAIDATATATNEQQENVTADNGQPQLVNEEAVNTNGEVKNSKPLKEKEPPKDPREDPIGWVEQQTKAAEHKVNFFVLQWIHKILETGEQEPIPVREPGFVTRSKFVDHLRDGSLLARVANKLSPGSVETVHEGEAAKDKNNQKDNIEGFLRFAKEKAEIPSEHLFDINNLLEKGKAGYQAILNTLFHLLLVAQEKFNQEGFDIDQIVQECSTASESNFIQNLLNIFKRANPTATIRKSLSQILNTLPSFGGQQSSDQQPKTNGETETHQQNGVEKAETSEQPEIQGSQIKQAEEANKVSQPEGSTPQTTSLATC